MKKLFVLFLLVALVPFTVGCGLFGDNDDTTPVNVAKLKASVTVPAAAVPSSLRAAKVAPPVKFLNYKLTMGNFTLVAIAEEMDASGNYKVDFESTDAFNTTQLATLKKAEVPVAILNPADETVSAAKVDFRAATPVIVTVALTTTGTIGGVTNETAPPTQQPTVSDAVAGDAASIVSVTNDGKAVSASTVIAKNATSGAYEFVITTNKTLTETEAYHGVYSVVVGETAVDSTHFTVKSVSGTAITLSLTQAAVAKLAVNKTYTVSINYISAGKYLVGKNSFSFKTPATL